jgi:hypothetical protein
MQPQLPSPHPALPQRGRGSVSPPPEGRGSVQVGQGYLFAKPMPAAELTAYLSDAGARRAA